jgi:DNA polymerase III alpha subunit
MKDEKRKRLKLEHMEDSMVNGVNVMNGRSEVGTATRQRRGEAASNQGRKQAISKQASKQSGVNEESWREDEERLLSVAFTVLNLNHSRQLEKLLVLRDVREKMNKEKKKLMEVIVVGLRNVMTVGSGVLRMKLARSSLEMESTTWSGVEAWKLVVASTVNFFPAHR